jgi:hypothetical protein
MKLAPIALFVYKRPEHTQHVLESLSQNTLAQKSSLFIFCDAAKKKQDQASVHHVRQIAKSKKWCGKVKIIERSKNWGLAKSIIAGVTELCNQYGKVIVLEDDLVLSPYFLDYMNQALTQYQADPRVMHISGYMFPLQLKMPETFFLQTASCWGWATWKRAWDHFNPNGEALYKKITDQNLKYQFDYEGSYPFLKMLKNQVNGIVDSWAVRWYATIFLNGGLCLHPGQSLTQNKGLDGSGTHGGADSSFETQLMNHPVRNFTRKIGVNDNVTVKLQVFFKSRNRLGQKIFRKIETILRQRA